MGTTIVSNAQPRGYALGFKDESRGSTTPERVTTPQFYPLMWILSQRVYDESVIISGNADAVLGTKTLTKGSEFYMHQNAFLKKLAAKSNQVVVETVSLPGSAKAFLRISVEVIPTDIPVYQRIQDSTLGVIGEYAVDELGSYIKTGTIHGSKLVHHVGFEYYTADQSEFGKAKIKTCRLAGATINNALLSSLTVTGLTNPVSAATTLYPIVDIEMKAYGKFGNLVGLSVLSPTTQDECGRTPKDLKLNKAVSYRFVTVEKASFTDTPETVYLLTGDQALDATLKLETTSSLTGNPISLEKTLVPAYSKKASTTAAAVYGNWGRVKVYDRSLETLLTMLANGYSVSAGGQQVDIEGEGSFDTDPVISLIREDWALLSDPLNTHLINIFSGADHNNIPYSSFTTAESASLGGVTFDSATPQYASGGADGLYYYSDGRPAVEVNSKLYDDAVRSSIKNFGSGNIKYKDALRYPVSNIIDSGFSLETKLVMPTILSKRPDMWVMAATHAVYDVGQAADDNVRSIYRDGNISDVQNITNLVTDWGLCGQQTQTVEDAYGAALKAAFNTTMESDFYSTPVTRAVIRGQSGRVIEDGYWDGYLPLTYELTCQLSDFMGDSSGIWRPKYDFTIEPNNVIQLMEDINNTYRENSSYSKLWDIGVNWSCSYDQFRYYTPALQTVYPYDDSILNSAKLMFACCRLEHINLIVHSRLTGRDDLTDDEFIAETKKIAEEEIEGIFAGKYIVESEPKILDSDKDAGYIWRNFFNIYGNVMKTAMIYGIIARRMSDYTGTAA